MPAHARLRGALCAAAIVCLAAAPAAHGRTQLAEGPYLSPLELSGDQAFAVRSDATPVAGAPLGAPDAVVRLSTASPAAAPAVIVSSRSRSRPLDVLWDASSQGFAAVSPAGRRGAYAVHGGTTVRLPATESCHRPSVDAGRLAVVACDRRSIVIRNLDAAGPPAQTIAIGGLGPDAKLAGNFLAYTVGGGGRTAVRSVAVRDLTTGTDVATIPGTALSRPAPRTAEFDLQPDGKVVAMRGCIRRAGQVAVWSGPGVPAPRAVIRDATGCRSLEIGGDRIAYEAGGAALAIADLTGRRLRTIDRYVRDTDAPFDAFDLDGDRLVYNERTCAGAAVMLVDLTVAQESQPPDATCAVDVADNLQVDRRGRVVLPLTCQDGCIGRTSSRFGPSRDRDRVRFRGTFMLPARGDAQHVLVARLTAAQRRRIADGDEYVGTIDLRVSSRHGTNTTARRVRIRLMGDS